VALEPQVSLHKATNIRKVFSIIRKILESY
jgi:hypothetical protein